MSDADYAIITVALILVGVALFMCAFHIDEIRTRLKKLEDRHGDS